ncbi:MAG: 50S ribosomal protein L23 [Chloroflexi bacterium HGW-Chloroflexi-1]|nr:MAG: 50S ribosomal protein L23 [Chloroflexi bacterium HGW-Chloroflexi-1]
MHVYDILKRPIVTEKTTGQATVANQYTFEVDRRANKLQVKDAVETVFDVSVTLVRISNIPAKKGRYGRLMVTKKAAWKKAVVTLAPGNTIQSFEGV